MRKRRARGVRRSREGCREVPEPGRQAGTGHHAGCQNRPGAHAVESLFSSSEGCEGPHGQHPERQALSGPTGGAASRQRVAEAAVLPATAEQSPPSVGTLGSYTLRGKFVALLVPRRAKQVLLTATGLLLLPWVLQEALGSSWKELLMSGGELPVTGGVHLEWVTTLGHAAE